MDPQVEQKVIEWKEAKERKDYASADQLRSELREAGYDPDKPRKGNSQEPEVDMKIQQWQDAKKNKDFITADLLRAELRAKGVEPDPRGSGGSSKGNDSDYSWGGKGAQSFMPAFASFQSPMSMPWGMPASYSKPAGYGKAYDHSLEAQLDQWVEARAEKDWGTADSIRDSLRSRGISPSKERPQKDFQAEIEQWQRAKKAKDFDRSDRIRESLRAQGCDPDSMGMGGQGMGSAMPMAMGMPSAWMQAAPMKKESWGGAAAKAQAPSLSSMDPRTMGELNQWFEAKDEKNYAMADTIREKLRAKGVEPANCQRPGSAGLDADMSDELRQWFDARDQKNFSVADAIRERLRAKGVEPSQCQRPGDAPGSGYGKAAAFGNSVRSTPYSAAPATGSFDFATETRLDDWWKAKQEKNYTMADNIRQEMRAQGVEPEQHRPRR